MKKIKLLLKYYLYSFLVTTVLVTLVLIYIYIFDDFFYLIDFNLYFKAISLMALLYAFNLYIINLLDNINHVKNKYQKMLLIGVASYWFGLVLSILFLSVISFLFSFISNKMIYLALEEHFLLLSTTIAIPVAYVSKFLIKKE